MKTERIWRILASVMLLVVLAACQKQLLPDDSTSMKEDLPGIAPAQAGLVSTPIQVYGVWHAGNDYCTWATERTVAEFDSKNHWIIDRGNGQPSVNVVVLSFVQPLKLLNKTNDANTVNGVPKGMTADIVNYFKSRGIRVMLS